MVTNNNFGRVLWVFLVVVIIVMYFGGRDSSDIETSSEIESRLSDLESKLNDAESVSSVVVEESVDAVYIVQFKPMGTFAADTPQELLTEFNKHHPSQVKTHHFRTKAVNDVLYGYMCVDGKKGKDAVVEMLNSSDNLEFVNYKQASEADIAIQYSLKQESVSGAVSQVRVKATYPAVYDNKVPATLEALQVNFNTAMRDRSWSWTGSGERYPKLDGEVSYDSSITTCRMPVKLEPGKVYMVGINSPSHKNFKSKDGIPATPFVLIFATANPDGSPTEIPTELIEYARRINGAAKIATLE